MTSSVSFPSAPLPSIQPVRSIIGGGPVGATPSVVRPPASSDTGLGGGFGGGATPSPNAPRGSLLNLTV